MPVLHLLGAFLFLCRTSALSEDSWKGCKNSSSKNIKEIELVLEVSGGRNTIKKEN